MRIAIFTAAMAILLAPPWARADYAAGLAAYDRGDFQAAAEAWMGPAEAGDPKAQLGLGVLFETGGGVPVDPAAASAWYARAAAQGVAPAMYNLGRLALEGRGMQSDPARALSLWRRAAEAGMPQAAHNMGVMRYAGIGAPQDYAAAAAWFRQAAEGGYADSQFMLGEIKRLGLDGQPDPSAAAQWLRLAESRNHPEATSRLALLGFDAGPSAAAQRPAAQSAPAPAGRTASPGGRAVGATAGATQTAARPDGSGAAGEGAGQAGGYAVWLASFSSADRAEREWRDLSSVYGDVLGRVEPEVRQVNVEGKTFHRLLAGAFAEPAEAQALCAALKARVDSLFCRPVER